MPELPEVETTRRGIAPHLVGKPITGVIVRDSRLRHPVSADIEDICGKPVTGIRRRGKYLIADTDDGALLIHLGMSGSLRVCERTEDHRKHDHVILCLPGTREIRYHDPRRFGIVLHLPAGDPLDHPLLASLGPEPLSDEFTTAHLKAACKGRTAPIKQVIMDAGIVVGVGNIYASEALHRAGIRPRTAARRVSGPRLARLVAAIREVLAASIEQGGTTLRDFVNSDGQPGYFRQRLFVYGRAEEPCRSCSTPIRHAVLGQRATYWCPVCQR
ncbi:formamidopyrimidine-DNA glycosylase [Haloferula helveola]|uniref:Formamidopyrimidine-DNA glycosylase n=1 Tax=Haloferula helveola TaxID=490095 RepID=A0ABM7RJN8_9BACT|nr:formamidopyrimidine-DNA glycosylase [Haloferula helveola]